MTNPYVTLDRLAPDLVAECPDCNDLAPKGATVCESCGAHLFVRVGSGRQFKAPRQIVVGCTCGGNGICTACVLALYDKGEAL